MKLKITKITLICEEGKFVSEPKNKFIDSKDLEILRASVKKEATDTVLFNYEEIGEE